MFLVLSFIFTRQIPSAIRHSHDVRHAGPINSDASPALEYPVQHGLLTKGHFATVIPSPVVLLQVEKSKVCSHGERADRSVFHTGRRERPFHHLALYIRVFEDLKLIYHRLVPPGRIGTRLRSLDIWIELTDIKFNIEPRQVFFAAIASLPPSSALWQNNKVP
jgi:hypothetical protein